MIKLRPWKDTKNEFEADIIVNGPNGRTLRKRVKAPVTGKSNAEAAKPCSMGSSGIRRHAPLAS